MGSPQGGLTPFADANTDARSSTIALSELCSDELKILQVVCLFCGLTLTTMVLSRWLVNLIILFLGRLRSKRLTIIAR